MIKVEDTKWVIFWYFNVTFSKAEKGLIKFAICNKELKGLTRYI